MMVIEPKHYGIEETFNLIGEQFLNLKTAKGKKLYNITVDGFRVYPISLRYMTFYQKGTVCACCGKKATHFRLCGEDDSDRRHFNLYADDGTLFTKDHIIPKSKGGLDCVENMQTMCSPCNMKKADNYTGLATQDVFHGILLVSKEGKVERQFKNLKTAAIFAVTNLIHPQQSMSAIVEQSVCAAIGVQNAVRSGESYCGHFWKEV